MNKAKRQLQEFANKSLDELNNNEFKEKLVTQQQFNQDQCKKMSLDKKWKAIIPIASAMVVIAIVLVCLLLLPSQKDPQGEKFYAYENALSKDATLEDIEKYLNEYNLNTENIVLVKLVYDSVSGDDLYFRLTWENEEEFSSCYVDFIINPYYKPASITFDKQTVINGLQVDYHIESEYDDEYEMFINNVDGETKIGDVLIRFLEYDSITENEESGFLEFVENLFFSR